MNLILCLMYDDQAEVHPMYLPGRGEPNMHHCPASFMSLEVEELQAMFTKMDYHTDVPLPSGLLLRTAINNITVQGIM